MKRRKRGIILLALGIAVCALGIWGGFSMWRASRYRAADRLLSSGAYSEAITAFAGLGDYRDSDRCLEYAILLQNVENADWADAQRRAEALPGFRDADQFALCAKAGLLAADGAYEEAILTLRDATLPEAAALEASVAEDYAQKTVSEVGPLIAAEDWDDASARLARALEFCADEEVSALYETCQGKIRARDYGLAAEDVRRGDYDGAAALYRALGDYEDSAAYLSHLESGDAGRAYLSALFSEETDPHPLAEAFAAAGDYLDAAAWAADFRAQAQAADYAQAKAEMDAGRWDAALALFQTLEPYGDSAVLARACEAEIARTEYESAQELMDGGDCAGAAAAFLALGDYADAPVRAIVCQNALNRAAYARAVSLYAAGAYEEALDEFTSLGDYGDSPLYCERIETKIERSAGE